ncbi:MAG: DNA polymerase, partial [Bacteroidota bacterium]
MAALEGLNITLKPVTFDTMIVAYILHSHLRTFDLDTLSQRELGYTMISFGDVAGSKKKEATLLDADGEKVAEYAAEDAVITFRLFEHFKRQLDSEPNLKRVAEEIDFPLIPVLRTMERRGVCIDTAKLKTLEIELDKEITMIRARIESYTSEPININSPVQLQKLLFEDLKLATSGMRATKNGISTAAQELEKLQGLHPVIDDILRYRELTKLLSTYVKTLPGQVDQEGRVHTNFSQTTAATGRLASLDPNLQNIPIRTELGGKIRTAFIAPPGSNLLSLDYSQIELRIIAHVSGDTGLQQAFLDGRDIHDEVATRLKIDRRTAKAINFGIIYGLSAYGLSQGLKIDPKIAKQYIDTYFSTYPQVANYLEQIKIEIREKGYVETLFGRRREIPEIYASNSIIRAQAERMAVNAPAQGTAADLMKLAMIRVHEWLENAYHSDTTRPYLILQVHDELLLEVPHVMT